MWTYYSIGDATFLVQVLNAVALVTQTGDFIAMAKVGLLLGAFSVALQALFKPGQGIAFQQVFVSWLMFACLFMPKTTVVVEDVYSGQTLVVNNVPLGVGVAGSVISTIGLSLTQQFDTAFSTPAMTRYGFADSLQLLMQVREQLTSHTGLQQANKVNGSNIHEAWRQYIKECTLIGIDVEQTTADAIAHTTDPTAALRFDSSVYVTEVTLNHHTQVLTCSEAYAQLTNITQSQYLPRVRQALSASLGTHSATDADTELRNALNHLGLTSVSTQQFMLASVLAPIYQQSVVDKHQQLHAFNAALMVEQAAQQRQVQWAAEQSVFQRIVRPMMTFFEGFIVAITPMMAFVVTLGATGINMVGKYLLMLIWIQLWMPILAIINLYLHLAATKKLSALAYYADMPSSSFAGIHAMDSVLQTWLATGGMLASSVPAISLLLVYGSAITATHLAGRLQGGDTINEQQVSPSLTSAAPVLQNQPLYQHSSLAGTHQTGAQQLVSQFSTEHAASSLTAHSQEQLQQVSQQFSQQLASTTGNVFSDKHSYEQFKQLGQQLGTNQSHSQAVVKRAAKDLQQQFGFGDEHLTSVQGAITGVISGGISMGGKYALSDMVSKVMPFGEKITNALDSHPSLGGVRTALDTIGKSRIRTNAGGNLSAQLGSHDASQARQQQQTLTSTLQSLGKNDTLMAEYRNALVKDFGDSERNGLEQVLSESQQSTLQESASNVASAAERVQHSQQLSQSLKSQRSIDGLTLSKQLANTPSAMNYLDNYLVNHPEAAHRVRENMAQLSAFIPNTQQAKAAAALETLTYSQASTSAEQDNDKQAALQLLQMAMPTLPLSNLPKQTDIPSLTTPAIASPTSLGQSNTPVGAAPLSEQFSQQGVEFAQRWQQTDIASTNQSNQHQLQTQTTPWQQSHAQQLSEPWKQAVMQQDPSLTMGQSIYSTLSGSHIAQGNRYDPLAQLAINFGDNYETHKQAVLDNPESAGIFHQTSTESHASWEGMKAAMMAGMTLNNPLTAYKDTYDETSDTFNKQVTWGTQIDAMLAGAHGAMFSGHLEEYVADNQQSFKEAAFNEGIAQGLTPVQSQIFAQAIIEGLSGSSATQVESGDISPTMQTLRESLIAEQTANGDPLDGAFIDQQMHLLYNAANAGRLAPQQLLNLRGYNQARQLELLE